MKEYRCIICGERLSADEMIDAPDYPFICYWCYYGSNVKVV